MTSDLGAFGRRLMLMIGAAGFLTAQLALQDKDWGIGTLPDRAAIVGMALWGIGLLLILGPWLWRMMGNGLNDERVEIVRLRAFFWGYLLTMAAAAVLFVMGVQGMIGVEEAVHLILSVGIAAPMFAFAFLE
ncbi:hypothetical protein [Parvularcula sp. LCG005]|uniref:hypothetical protein n=1 Tax=Parvularcula sp. LCG005 TaxID=3078805 RepID=UPI0029436755|nr:hypothetical protein [Parvularcula sp. LCG005]WOI52557.1 hypothetical protein RUI03_10400 [Parvularcula sp. LCG005]